MKTKKVNGTKTKAVSTKHKVDSWAEDDVAAASEVSELKPKKVKKSKDGEKISKVNKVEQAIKVGKNTKANKIQKADKIKQKSVKSAKKVKKAKKQVESSDDEVDIDEDSNEAIDDEDDDEENEDNPMAKLKEIDPEFYKFLEQNDKKLLKFNPDDENDGEEEGSDNDESDNDGENGDDDDDDDGENNLHKPLDTLELASDESDFEDENNPKPRKANTVTLKLLKQWQGELQQDKVPLDTIKSVILALNSTLITLAGETDSSAKAYEVGGAAAFNGVIQLCVLHLESAIRRFLGLHQKTSLQPHKCKKWNKLKGSLRGYFIDMTKLLEQISSANILIVLLKHIHQSIPMILSFSSLLKPILKRLVTIWSTGEETVRVLAFLCILRITRSQQLTVLSTVLKAMYLSYVRNSKFVSPNTLPSINFMRRSLAEMFALDVNVSYQHVFLYIRQLAIHLRNAITLNKKESFQAVYNWQFVNSLRLWCELLACTTDKPQLQPMIYPLTSIIIGTIKLIPTAQYFPLRFHCIQALNILVKGTRTFIPVLPFITEVLNSNTFSQKHSKVSMKPLSFTCILRLSQSQLVENGFRDEVIENLIGCALDYAAHESFTISYPDLIVPTVMQLKHYLKQGKNVNSNHRSKLKQLLDKLEENSRYVVSERAKFSFELRDTASITAWETQLRNKGTPLLTYYTNWLNTHQAVQKRKANTSENLDEYNLPQLLKRKVQRNMDDDDDDDGPVDMFPSDDDEELLEIERQPKAKRAKKQHSAKVAERQPAAVDSDNDAASVDDVDIVKDLDMDDW